MFSYLAPVAESKGGGICMQIVSMENEMKRRKDEKIKRYKEEKT
jgi:hypothetical protein